MNVGKFLTMSITEIEAALRQLRPEELDRVEAILHVIRQRELAAQEEQLERENGFSVLLRRCAPLVTNEEVQRICDEEGI